MPSLCDVSFLLPLCYEAHEHYLVAKARLAQVATEGGFVLCRMSQMGLLRLLSNPVVMRDRVCTTDRAWEVYDTLLSDDRFLFRDEPIGIETRLREFTKGFPVSPKLRQDAYLAAFAVMSGCGFVTFDAGFDKFPGLGAQILGSRS